MLVTQTNKILFFSILFFLLKLSTQIHNIFQSSKMAQLRFIIVVIILTLVASKCLALKNTTKSKKPASLVETVKQTNLNKVKEFENITGTTFPSDRPTLVYLLINSFFLKVVKLVH